jgi:hypothetical protein
VIAYKFLAAGAVAPFTGVPWPPPDGRRPGRWLEARGAPEDGVHACRVRDLPYWFEDELWRVELDGAIAEAPYQVVGRRGRLLARVSGWDGAAAVAFGAGCADRLRPALTAALRAGGHGAGADLLSRAEDPAALAAAADRAAAGAEGELARLAAWLGDVLRCAGGGSPGGAAYVAARLAGTLAAAGAPGPGAPGAAARAFAAERAAQAAWLSARLGL